METCPTSYNKFVDLDKCLELVDEVHRHSSLNDAEKLIETFCSIVDKYQEQPELLDPYLNELIDKLLSGLNKLSPAKGNYHIVFKFLYQLIKVYGFKSIGKKFHHETDKLPLVIELLSKEDPNDKINWQTRYVLTVWMSIVILMPFDLSKYESSTIDNIYSLLIRGLQLHDSCQQVTAFCIAKFFSRPDVLKSDQYLNKFISIALDELASVKLGSVSSTDDIQLIGYLRTLAYMFKFLPRTEMAKHSAEILNVLNKLNIDKINRELVNYLIVKLIQRVGLAILPKPIASWRYKRGSRILGHQETVQETSNKPAKEHIVDDSQSFDNADDVDSAEYLESILNVLFVAAQNSQTKIRWSASKGIARLSSRLSKERANDVIDMLMNNFFKITSSEYAWHSGCLVLAELSQNGLILEDKLAKVITILGEAIIYDKIKGSFAVGALVREAACFACWAMARTYNDHLIKPFLKEISTNLLCTVLFDRQLQCRRAASATYQELVGRQGAFSNEVIDILNHIDYQSVGQLQFTYIHLASKIAGYNEQCSKAFVEHLIEKKVGHWDVSIRRLASDALSALMLNSRHEFISSVVLCKLIKMANQNDDNNMKHGALLGIAKVIRGLVTSQFEFDKELVIFVGDIVLKCEKQLKSKQQAPNFIEAICLCIMSAELASFHYPEDSDVVKHWESVVLTALCNDSASLRQIGSEAFITIYKTYYRDNKTSQDRLLTILNSSLTSPNESCRCGSLKALSTLSQVPSETDGKIKTDAETPDIILMSLTSYISKDTHEKSSDIVFAQAKAEACEAFVNFVRCLDKSRLIVSSSLIRAGFDALLSKMEDYTFDKRGDIGVVVRRAAIKAIQDLTLHLLSIGVKGMFGPETVGKMVSKILQQAVSYNNSARELAATAFYRLISSDLPENSIAHKREILDLLEKYGVNDTFNWRDESTPIFVSLLSKPEYSLDLWTGLMPSVGQLSDMCASQFRNALSDYIISLSDRPSDKERIFSFFMEALERRQLSDRILTSGLIVADYLLTQGLMYDTTAEFQERLFKFVWRCGQGADPKRLISVSRVLSSMLQFGASIQRNCLKYCLVLLLNGYAKVRVYTAEQLYQSIMTYESELEKNLSISQIGDSEASQVDQESNSKAGSEISEASPVSLPSSQYNTKELDLTLAGELLSETNWSEPIDKLRPTRDRICNCLLMEELQVAPV